VASVACRPATTAARRQSKSAFPAADCMDRVAHTSAAKLRLLLLSLHREMEDARRGMLSQILTPEASERRECGVCTPGLLLRCSRACACQRRMLAVNRVSIVKPEVGFRVGNQLIEMARAGRIRTKVRGRACAPTLLRVYERALARRWRRACSSTCSRGFRRSRSRKSR
jgi:DNA-binding TFAR19-related protein (PDSD5 family)